MARLGIRLLGPPQFNQDGKPLSAMRSDKVRALLAYLAVEADKPHRREKLAGLLWPGYPEESARASLRRALADLRQALRPAIGDEAADPPYLHITPQTIQFEPHSDAWVDALAFSALVRSASPVDESTISGWETAVELYQGEFMEGFSLPDSPEYEQWLVLTREQLRRQELETLGRLVECLEGSGEYLRGLVYAWRGVELDSTRESAQRGLMRLLALSGERDSALEQYEACAQALAKELGVEPSAETRELYEQIQKGEWPPAAPAGTATKPQQPRKIGASPYRGLSAFREQDTAFFFGREGFTGRLLDAIRSRGGAAVILGPSGSGKSSVVYAGLIPELREEGDWLIADLRPGASPFHALAAAMLPLLEPGLSETGRLVESQKLAAALSDGSLPLCRLVERVLEKSPNQTRLLLFIDQFEELYSLCRQVETRRSFLDGLLETVGSHWERRDGEFVLVLTMRADFLGQTLSYRPFADVLQSASLMMGPMTQEELRAAIEQPATVQGAAFESGLVERILEDVGDEPGNLPLLEFALMLLWERAESGWLTHSGYESNGKVEGALARYAEQVYGGLDEAECQNAKRVFLQLIRPGEGTGDTRRVATRDEVGEENWPLVQHLADRRLVVTDRDASANETAEVVHEALIASWGRLRGWIEADRTFRTWQERLRGGLRQWDASGGDEGALLRGAPLAEAEGWLAERGNDLTPGEQEYIRAGRELRRRRQAEVERSRRRIVAGLSVGLLLTLILALLAGWQWRSAQLQRNSAVQAQATAQAERDQTQYNFASLLAAKAISLLGTEADLSLLLSVESLRNVETIEGRSSLYTALSKTSRIAYFLRGHPDDVRSLAFDPDGRILATGDKGGVIFLWDVSTGRQIGKPLSGHQEQVNSLDFSPDGSVIASGSFDNSIILWDANKGSASFGQQIWSPLIGHADNVWSVAFSPDGRKLASGGADGAIFFWDIAEDSASFGQTNASPVKASDGIITSLAFSPDGHFLASGSSDNTVTLWDLRAGQPLSTTLSGHSGFVSSVAFSPDGRTLASAGKDDTIRLWDVDEVSATFGQPLSEPLTGHTDHIWGLAYSSQGDRLASGGEDGVILLWDVDRASDSFGRRIDSPLVGHAGPVYTLAFSPDGMKLASGGQDDLIILWDIVSNDPLVRELMRVSVGDPFNWVVFSPNLDRMVWAPRPYRTLKILDMEEASPTFQQPLGPPLVVPTIWVNYAAFSQDGKVLATANDDNTIILWDVDRASVSFGQTIGSPLQGHSDGVIDVAFSPDGKILASAGDDGTVRLWDVNQNSTKFGQQIGPPLMDIDGSMYKVHFSPDGKILAAGGDADAMQFWDVNPDSATFGKPFSSPLDCDSFLDWVQFNPTGTTLAATTYTCDGNPAILIWDVETGSASYGKQSGQPLQGHQDVIMSLAYSPSGRYLASGDYAGKILVWDIVTRRAMEFSFPGEEKVGESVTKILFSPDGQSLTAVLKDTRIFRWDFNLDSWKAHACQRANRNLTEQEWRQYFGDEPYRQTCPGL